MPTLSISLDGAAPQVLRLEQPRTTLGRRPYNDIVVDSLAVSGEHAVFVLHPDGVELIDLHSTNGTYVNGHAIDSVRLLPEDLIEIGRCQMRLGFEDLAAAPEPGSEAAAAAALAPAPALRARLRVLSGPATGKEMALEKPTTTLGKPGLAVAAISRLADSGFAIHWIDGAPAVLNGHTLSQRQAKALAHHDRLRIAGIEMEFLLD
ncbi:MAG: FHA domain-containing protein [Pseudomonadota bacterium]